MISPSSTALWCPVGQYLVSVSYSRSDIHRLPDAWGKPRAANISRCNIELDQRASRQHRSDTDRLDVMEQAMAEATQLVFSYKEVVTALIKAQGLHEGIWGLYVKFGKVDKAGLGF